MLRPQCKLQDLQSHIHKIGSALHHPVKKGRRCCRCIVYIAVFNFRKKLLLQFHRIVSTIFAADRQVIHMSHTSGSCHQRIERFRIRLRCHKEFLGFSDTDTEADIRPFPQIPRQFSRFFNKLYTFIIIHDISFIRHQYCQFVCHDRTHNAIKMLLETAPDLLIMFLHLDTAAHSIGHMVSLLFISADYSDHISILLGNSQNRPVIFNILAEMLLQQNIMDQSALNNGHHSLQFFFDQQLIFPFQALCIDSFHSFSKRRDDPGLFHGFGNIFHNPQFDRFFGIIKLIIGRHHNKHRMIIGSADLFHGINSVDPRHLNIHHRNVRPEALRQFNHTSAGFGILYLTSILKLFFNDKFQGVYYNSLIIRQHDLIHLSFPSPSPEDTG